MKGGATSWRGSHPCCPGQGPRPVREAILGHLTPATCPNWNESGFPSPTPRLSYQPSLLLPPSISLYKPLCRLPLYPEYSSSLLFSIFPIVSPLQTLGSSVPEAKEYLHQFSSVAQSCLSLCDPMDCSLPGSSVHGILQVRNLERVAFPFSRGSSQPRDQTQVSCIAGAFWSSISGHCLLPWVVGLQHERTPSIRAGTRQLDTRP